MAATFQDARLDAAGPVRYLVGRDVGQRHGVDRTRIPAGPRREDHPGRQDALTGQGEAQVTRLFLMQRSGRDPSAASV